MNTSKMSKEELEFLSNKDITNLILQEENKSMNTADLYKKIMKLLDLPESYFETKIADYYTALTTDKRFVLLDDGTWDLRSKHTSDKVIKITDDEDEEDDDEETSKEEVEDNLISTEDDYDDTDSEEYDEDENEDLKDLVILDEDELELEQ